MHEVSEPVAPARLLGQRRVDRALTAPPLKLIGLADEVIE